MRYILTSFSLLVACSPDLMPTFPQIRNLSGGSSGKRRKDGSSAQNVTISSGKKPHLWIEVSDAGVRLTMSYSGHNSTMSLLDTRRTSIITNYHLTPTKYLSESFGKNTFSLMANGFEAKQSKRTYCTPSQITRHNTFAFGELYMTIFHNCLSPAVFQGSFYELHCSSGNFIFLCSTYCLPNSKTWTAVKSVKGGTHLSRHAEHW